MAAATSERRTRWLRGGALLLGGLAVAEVLAAWALSPVAGMSWHDALDSFVVSNGVMGASFALGGLLIAWHRPTNPIGWLLVADGLGHATSAVLAPTQTLLDAHGAPAPVVRLAVTVFMFAWPWSIGLFLPLALLLFPDGRLPTPRWRPVAAVLVLTSPLFVLEMVADPEPVNPGLPSGYLSGSWYDDVSWLWTISEMRVLLALLVAIIALVVRYRRGTETERRQLLWLVMAVIVVIAAVAPWSFVAGTPVIVLFAIPLVPIAIAVAVVRHGLLDIRLVLSRALAWLLLSAVVLVAYVALVAVLDSLVSGRVGRSAFATVLVAVALAPLLPRLQREVDRWMYGDRRDPARVAVRLSEHLATGDERGLQGVVAALRSALRLPYAAVTPGDGVQVADGTRPEETASVPLEYAGEEVGCIEIGLRPGERQLSPVDASTLHLVAAPLAVAVRALRLSADLQASRGRIVVAREEERRRLRRDLHDGLGPTLTGVGLAADAAANLIDTDPDQSRQLLQSLRRDTRVAVADIRRLVDDLRPPALDEVGLLGALQQRADQLRWRPDGSAIDVTVVVPEHLPVLPAAVEVAAYRIATEALTNVARHAGASGAVLEVRCDTSLDVEVTDDGPSNVGWSPGVGLGAMRERAAEVGGLFEAGPSRRGGRVYVSIPLSAPLAAS
jgi:two-component system NarL family sensor kinase